MTAPYAAFEIARPRDVEGAVEARRENAGSRYLAGGTDLVVGVRRGLAKPDILIDLAGIEELTAIVVGEDRIRVGAGVTLAALAKSAAIRERCRAVAQAAETIAGPGHRAMATVGGNLCLDTRCLYYNQSEWWRKANHYCLKHEGDTCHVAPLGQRCHAAFTGDLAPALLVLGAQVEIAGAQGRRRVPLDDLYVEDGRAHLALAPDELIVAVELSSRAPASAYEKARLRGAIDYPLAGVAVALSARAAVVENLSVAITGTNSRPLRLAGVETLAGRAVDDATLDEIERLVKKQVQPMRTTTISANYRRLAAAALARKLVETLWREAHEAGRRA